eukprot:TRINITY_DN2945_c1_g3_i1.p1 TRINITY_DN2945_c1_g3~~TRINITY_DN2945_c1_g3_i1.p1  ORF type:complete len:280 (+),score=28.64 TRINITY_DN2945_c1_g3_i1:72-911(+)
MLSCDATVTVLSVDGSTILDRFPKPSSVKELKGHLESASDINSCFQKLLLGEVLVQDTDLSGPESLEVVLVYDESVPMISWDIQGNPNSSELAGAEGIVRFTSSEFDYVNVNTQHPVSEGVHFFEFLMHRIGDEQWCGITPFRERAGSRGGSVGGWFYYCGRRYAGEGELHAGRERNVVGSFAHVTDGDVIGMFVDMDEGRLVFTLNGEVQGACGVPRRPMYLTTCLDRIEDHVELRKVSVYDAPVSLDEVRALRLLSTADVELYGTIYDTSSDEFEFE